MSARGLRSLAALLGALALAAPAPASRQAGVQEALARARGLAAAGDVESALELLHLFDAEDTSGQYRPYVLVNAGELEWVLGRSSLALQTLQRADALLEGRPGDDGLRCYLLAVRAQIYLDLGLLDVAWREAKRAEELLLELEAKVGRLDGERIQVDYVRATVASSREDYLELEDVVEEALTRDVYARHPEQRAKLQARLGLGLKEAARLDPEQAARARQCLEEALAVEGLPPLERALPELALGELALREGRFEECELWIERAGRHLDAAGPREELPQQRSWLALSTRLAVERQDRPATREEREALRATLARALDRSLEEWSRREVRPGGYGFLQYADQRSLLSEWIRLELELSGDAGAALALERVVRAGDAGTLARRLGAEPAGLARSLEELLGPPEEHALLVYLPGPDRSHLFVADRARVVHVPLVSIDALEQARVALLSKLELVQRPDPSASALGAWERALARCADLLLPSDARAALGDRERVTIVGRDLLGDLPFEALPFGEGERLGCARALSYLPSLAAGRVLASRAAREVPARAGDLQGAAQLLAAPRSSGLSLERGAAVEMLAPYPERAARIRFGEEATLDGLHSACGAARVLELFTHGSIATGQERPRTLLLDAPNAAGASLDADQVETLDAPPLVVLAVCRSGQGPRRRGDASASELATSFFLAGSRARCVLASAFDLDAEATRLLSGAFHAGLVAGLAPDEALRAARRELARDPRWSDPRFHGLISAIGAAGVPLFRP